MKSIRKESRVNFNGSVKVAEVYVNENSVTCLLMQDVSFKGGNMYRINVGGTTARPRTMMYKVTFSNIRKAYGFDGDVSIANCLAAVNDDKDVLIAWMDEQLADKKVNITYAYSDCPILDNNHVYMLTESDLDEQGKLDAFTNIVNSQVARTKDGKFAVSKAPEFEGMSPYFRYAMLLESTDDMFRHNGDTSVRENALAVVNTNKTVNA